MIKRVFRIIILLFPFPFFSSCGPSTVPVKSTVPVDREHLTSLPGPACIIYKTKADYTKNVPVILSADKTTIESFPDIRDVFYQGKLAYPSELYDGYLLDNRGISPGVAFLDYTYEEYSRLMKTPQAEDLMKHLLDSDPLVEMYGCGRKNQYSDPVNSMNIKIKDGQLKECNRLK